MVVLVRDPLSRPIGAGWRSLGRGALIMIAAVALHILILAGFIVANLISEALEEEPPPAEEKTEVVVAEPEPEPEENEPEPEPEPEPLPADALEPTIAPQDLAPAPPIGISEASTVEGGTGPAFQTGVSLLGAMGSGGLAQEILGREAKSNDGPEEMVMTAETVDTLPKPVPSNRTPSTPAKAQKKGLSGFVTVRLFITADGSVGETKVVRAEPEGVYEDVVLETVASWRFEPATYKGRPVSMPINQTFRFKLE